MQKVAFVISFAILAQLNACISVRSNMIKLKERSEIKWTKEIVADFNWNETQQLHWSVINAFDDVQVSPDGDIYAVQKLYQEDLNVT